MKKTYLKSTLLALVFMVAPVLASADIMNFDLGVGNDAISGYTGPYASVQVNQTDTTHATITFTSLVNSGNIYLLGDGSSVAVNVNAASWTLGTISGSNSGTGFTPGPWSDDGAKNVDGFGIFNQTIDSFDGFGHSADTISFILTNTSGGAWANAASVLTDNTDGYLAAAHIFVTADPAKASNGAIATGYAANGGNPVPEPATMLLFGTGLASLAGMVRRKGT